MTTRWEQELLDQLYAPLDEHGRRIPARSLPEAVANWPPPRGPRHADGWRWSLATRPDKSFVNAFEHRAVEGYRALASELVTARQVGAFTVRALSAESGIAVSVLTGQEHGSAWPSFDTLARTSGALGHRVQVAGPRVLTPGKERTDPVEFETACARSGYPVTFSWRVLVLDELRHRMLDARVSKSALARAVGLRHNTVIEKYGADLRKYRSPSVRTLAAMCARLDTRLQLVPSSEPWT